MANEFPGNAFDGLEPDKQTPRTNKYVGASDNKWTNVYAASGEYDGLRADNGVMVLAPNGSGWHLRVDNAGSMSIDGPVDLS